MYMMEEKKQGSYDLVLIGSNKIITLTAKHLIDLDTLTTNFKDKNEIINYINKNYKLDYKVNDILLTSEKNTVEMIFNDKRDIVTDQTLVSKIIKYFSYYDNIKNLDIQNLNNNFLLGKIKEVMCSPTVKEYNFRLENFRKNILNGYKHKRDIALLIDKRKKSIKQSFFDVSHVNIFDKYEVDGILMGLGLSIKDIKENTQIEMDDYLQYLISNKDKIEDFNEEVSRNEDIDDLDGYNEIDVYDGNRGKRR
jgi:hypothetical protein